MSEYGSDHELQEETLSNVSCGGDGRLRASRASLARGMARGTRLARPDILGGPRRAPGRTPCPGGGGRRWHSFKDSGRRCRLRHCLHSCLTCPPVALPYLQPDVVTKYKAASKIVNGGWAPL